MYSVCVFFFFILFSGLMLQTRFFADIRRALPESATDGMGELHVSSTLTDGSPSPFGEPARQKAVAEVLGWPRERGARLVTEVGMGVFLVDSWEARDRAPYLECAVCLGASWRTETRPSDVAGMEAHSTRCHRWALGEVPSDPLSWRPEALRFAPFPRFISLVARSKIHKDDLLCFVFFSCSICIQ